jgi:hypothetical protein
LLHEFVRRDAEGDFLRTNDWYGTAVMCPGHVPGWDEATLILGYQATSLEETDTLSLFEVRYEEAGTLTQDERGMFLREEQQVTTDTFRLLKTAYGWRIESPIQHQRIMPKAALGLNRMHPASRARLVELLQNALLSQNLVLSCEGNFPADLSADALAQRYGAANVAHDSLYLGEGMFEQGTILFPTDSTRRAEILWKDIPARRNPRVVRVTAQNSKWQTPNGLKIGLDLRGAEKLNGRAFRIAGFGFDGSGTVTSWDGQLASGTTSPCEMRARFNDLPSGSSTQASYRQVIGDRIFSSGHPALQTLNPKLSLLWLEYR